MSNLLLMEFYLDYTQKYPLKSRKLNITVQQYSQPPQQSGAEIFADNLLRTENIQSSLSSDLKRQI